MLTVLYHVLAPLDCSPSHSVHHLVRTEFSQFSTTSPAACLCSNYLLFVTVSNYLVAVFSPTFAEEISVYCILAGLESKGRNLWWPNLLQPNSSQSLITKLFRKRVRRHVELSVALRKIISCQMTWYNKNIFLFPENHFYH